VVMAFPNGLAGLMDSHVKPWWERRRAELAQQKAARARRDAEAASPSAPLPSAPAQDQPLPPGVQRA
jgi:urea transport system permease protein